VRSGAKATFHKQHQIRPAAFTRSAARFFNTPRSTLPVAVSGISSACSFNLSKRRFSHGRDSEDFFFSFQPFMTLRPPLDVTTNDPKPCFLLARAFVGGD